MDILPVALLVLGLAVGGAVGWFVARSAASGLRTELEGERRAAAERAAHADRVSAERTSEREQAWQDRLAAADAAAELRLTDERERAAERLRAERESAQIRVAEIKADTDRLGEAFAALSAKALSSNSETFLAQAEERLKRAGEANQAELAKREEAVRSIVDPLTRTLSEVRAEVTAAEKTRAQAHGALAEQVSAMRLSSDELRSQTSQLVNALRAPQVRGRWGELQLRRVVEAAGMVAHVDFTEQGTVHTDDGMLRPDLVVHLPGDKDVVVDAKVAFGGFLEAMEATDEAVRNKRLAAHARHVRDHIDALGAKAYWEHLTSTPEFVVMFIPAETFLNAALEQDPTLLERAFERNVVLATPATLVALLRTVAYTWRQERLAADAQQVFLVGRELHKRLATFGKHLNDLGRRINSTVDSFNTLNRSLDSQLVTQVRRFSALQGMETAMETPPPLEVLAVPAAKADLHAGADEPAQITRRAGGDPARAERDAVLDDDDVHDDALIALADAGPHRSASQDGRRHA